MANVKGITIKLGADTTGLTKALSKINSETRKTQNQLKQVNTLLKFDSTNTNLITQKQSLLQNAISRTKAELTALKTAGEKAQVALEKGEISQAQFDKLQLSIAKTENELKRLEGQAKSFGAYLPTSLLIAQKHIEAFGEKCINLGNKLKGVSAAAAAVGTGATLAANEVETGFNKVIKKTGATGQEAEKLEQSFKKVASNSARSFDEIGDAMGALSARLNLTGSDLEAATDVFLKFALINETDVESSIQAVTQAMGDAQIPASGLTDFLDALTVASQKTGIDVNTLAGQMKTAGASMRTLGFTTQESIAILSKWEQAGVNTTTAISGLKQAVKKWASEGKEPREEFKKTLEVIKSAPSIAEAAGIAMQVFGTRAGNDMADAIYNGRFEVDQLMHELDNSHGTVNRVADEVGTSTGKMKKAFNNLKLAGAELGNVIKEQISALFEKITNILQKVTALLSNLNNGTKNFIVTALAITAAISPFLIIIGKVSSALAQAIISVKNIIIALAGLSKFLVANPYLAIASAIALVVSGLIAWKAAVDNQNSAQKQLQTTTDNLNQSLKERQALSLDATSAANGEVQTLFNLWNQLKSVTDETGKVQAGKENLADAILNKLNNAFGTEYSLVDNQIKNYKDLCSNIDSYMQKKKAQILLDGNEEVYSQAIKKQKEYQNNYKNNLAEQRALEDEITKLKEKSAWLRSEAEGSYLLKQEENLKKQKKITQESLQDLQANANEISSYTAAISAMAQGQYNEVERLLSQGDSIVITAASVSNKALSEQKQILDQNLNDINKAYEQAIKNHEANSTAMSEDEKQMWANVFKEAKAQQDEFQKSLLESSGQTYEVWKAWAENDTDAYISELSKLPNEVSGYIQELTGVPQSSLAISSAAWGNMSKESKIAYLSNLANLPAETKMTLINTAGLISNDYETTNAWATLASENKESFNNIINDLPADEQAVIASMAQAAANDSSVSSGFDNMAASSKGKFEQVIRTIPDRTREEISKIAGAINNCQYPIRAASENIARIQERMNVSGASYSWGEHAVANLANAIQAGRNLIANASLAIANTIHSILGHTTPKDGPLKDDDKWGLHLIENISKGMLNNKSKVKYAARQTANIISDSLQSALSLNMQDFINDKNINLPSALIPNNSANSFKNTAANVSNNYSIGSPVLKIENFNNNTNQDMRSLTLEFLQTADSYAKRRISALGMV